jgi:type IV secretory pathway VirB2 component (pilin)
MISAILSTRAILATIAPFIVATIVVAPAFAAGSNMPWEQPLQQILQSIEGPVSKIVAVIIIIVTGLTLAFGDTAGGFPRAIGPMLYDSIINACRKAGFEPVIGQIVPQIASIIVLVAAELGVSIVPASMSQIQVAGVTYRAIAGDPPTAALALAHRRGETSPIVRNFIARALT